MSHECSHNSCSHGHHHDAASSSCEHCQHCSCSCHKKKCSFVDDLFKLADDAWMELLKDKIKDEILKNSKDNIEQLAKLAASSNQARWSEKLAEKRNKDEFEEHLKAIMYKKR